MPPRPKPLRLPLSAFSAPPPSPTSQTVDTNRTVDAHLNAKADVARVLDGYSSAGGRKIMGAVGITRTASSSEAGAAKEQQPSAFLRTGPVHPILLPSASTPGLDLSSDVLDFEVVLPTTLDDAVWDEIDRVLDNVAQVAREVQASETGSLDGVSAASSSTSVKQPTVVLSGLLPPPLPSNLSSTMLPHQAFYQTYVRQLSALALVPGVCLKFLPPTILNSSGDSAGWWTDEDDLISVLKHFIIPALDSFGSHRILFGSWSVPLTLGSSSTATLTPAVPDAQREWYPFVIKLMRSLKLDRESVGEIMAGSAGRVYGLEKEWQK